MTQLQNLATEQPDATDRLRKAFQTSRLHHAYVIAGADRGCGKKLALGFGQLLVCTNPQGNDAVDACGACAGCRQFVGGNHPDVLTVEPNERGLIPIDMVRPLSQRLALKPVASTTKVVMIIQADCMNGAAQNALLKTLEEPPPCTCFLLTTARYRKLLPTIRSRIQKVQLSAPGQKSCVQALTDGGIEPNLAGVLAALVGSNVERANEVRDLGALEITEALERALGTPEIPGLLDLAKDLGGDALRMQLALDLLVVQMRDHLARRHGAGADKLYGKPVGNPSPDALKATVDRLNAVARNQVFNPNRTLTMETLLLGLTGKLECTSVVK